MQGGLSLIDNINVNLVEQTMSKIATFQEIIRKTLVKDCDYGVIEGTTRPTLWKSGGEKIIMVLGLSSKFYIIEKTENYDPGFFSYTVECQLWRGDDLITIALGSCNTRERRFNKQDPCTVANSALKTAKKRAMIDAALTVGALSDIFTQDLDDTPDLAGDQKKPPSGGSQQPKGNKISSNQVNAIKSRMRKLELSENDVTKVVWSKFQARTLEDLTKGQASEIITEMDGSTADGYRVYVDSLAGEPEAEQVAE